MRRKKGVTRRGALGGAFGTIVAAEAQARVGGIRVFGGGTPPGSGTPSVVNLMPPSVSIPDSTSLPTNLCAIAVTMTSGSFTGSLTENNPNTSISGSNLQLDSMPAAGLTNILVSATQNSITVSSTFALTVTVAGPATPVAVNLSPSSATVFNTASLPVTLCTYTVTMSDGSTFSGSVTENGPNSSISGSTLRLDSMPGDGSSSIVVTATQNSVSASATLNLSVVTPGVMTNLIIPGSVVPGSIYSHPTESLRGMVITVGGSPITLYGVGRWKLAGNSAVHRIAIKTYTGGGTVEFIPGGLASVNMSGPEPAGTFVYGALQGPVVLNAGASYCVMSLDELETTLNTDTVVATTAAASIIAPCGASTSFPTYCVPMGSANHTYGPFDLQYQVGVPAGYPAQVAASPFFSGEGGSVMRSHTLGVVSGVATFDGAWQSGVVGIATYQCVLYTPGGAELFGPMVTGNIGGGAPCTFDTTTVPDGSYVAVQRFYEWDSGAVQSLKPTAMSIVIANGGPPGVPGSQDVPCAQVSNHQINPHPEIVHYDASQPNPAHNTYPMPYTTIAKATSRNDPIYAEIWQGPRVNEYHGIPQWVTFQTGGVGCDYLTTLIDSTTETAYGEELKINSMDGTRLNALVTPHTNYVEDPDVSGKWWGVEINGRVFKIDRDGTTTTVFGVHRDKTRLTLHHNQCTEGDIEDIRLNIGTYPAGVTELGGANDLCFDPRDHNILYVACQIDHWIAKINLSAQVATVYAGVPSPEGTGGSSFGYVDGPVATARFNMPTSLIMDGSGNMYISDRNNSAIRKIDPSGTTVSTFCGGTVGPPPPTLLEVATDGPTYNVSGTIVWDDATYSAPVTLTAPASIMPGQTLRMFGSVAAAGDWNSEPNGALRYIVTNVVDSTHFSITFERNLSVSQSVFHPGTLSGSITLKAWAGEVYSPPGTQGPPFSVCYTPFPQVIRFTSTGNIAMGDAETNSVRLIDLSAQTIRRIGGFNNRFDTGGTGGFGWLWIDVDTAGAMGVVDDIAIWKVQDSLSAAHYSWRVSLAGSSIPGQPAYGTAWFGDNTGSNLPTMASSSTITEGPGHYPWAVAFSKHEGRMISTGMASWHPTYFRVKQASDPVVEHGDSRINYSDLYVVGQEINTAGTVPGFPWEARPAFAHLWGRFGATLIGSGSGPHTFEDLMTIYPPGSGDAGLTAFIQGGMGGTTPRPEMTGNDLRSYIYFIRRGTLQGSLGPTPVQPGPNDLDVAGPVILTASASRDGGNPNLIHINWTTNKPSLGLAGCASSTQAGLTSYPFYAIESSYGTSHSVTVLLRVSMTPVHWRAVARDNAGNISSTVDQSIS